MSLQIINLQTESNYLNYVKNCECSQNALFYATNSEKSQVNTRQYSSRMHATCLPTTCVVVASTEGGCGVGGWVYIPPLVYVPSWYTQPNHLLYTHSLWYTCPLVCPPTPPHLPPEGTWDKAYPLPEGTWDQAYTHPHGQNDTHK